MLDRRQGGFTLIELLLAMAVFSFGLLIILTGLVSLLGLYTSGRANRVVQNAARTGINMISQHALENTAFTSGNNILCMSKGNSGSMFYINANRLMYVGWDPSLPCNAIPANQTGTPAAVTSSDVQVVALSAEGISQTDINPCTSGCSGARVSLRVASTTTGLNVPKTACLANSSAGCVVTTVSTTITSGQQQ